MEIRRVTDQMSVSPQISVADIPAIAAAGFKLVINNRPDGEAPGQPASRDIASAAEAAGLAFVDVPVTNGAITAETIAAHRAAMDAAQGPVFAYCRSGTRSCKMWALAEAGRLPAQDILTAGAEAGYDLRDLLPALSALSGMDKA